MSRWQQSGPNTFTTPFDPIEKITHYYVTINPHRPQWAITPSATLTSSYSASQIKAAWKALRYHHPAIAVTVDSGKQELVYKSPSPEEVTQWIEETVSINPTALSARDVALLLPVPRSGEIHWLPGTNEVILHLPHEISDGIGSIILLNRFIKLLRTQETVSTFSGEEERLPPSLLDLIGIKKWREEENYGLDSEGVQTAEGIFSKFLGSDSVAVGIRGNVDVNTVPTIPYGREEIHLSPEETAAVVSACKDAGITVTNAIMAANALTIQQYDPDGSKKTKISNLVSVNMRPALDETQGGDKFQAGGNMFVDTFSVYDLDTSFTALAKEIKKDLTRWKSGEFVPHTPLTNQRLQEVATKMGEEGTLGSSGFVVSSLGVVEKYLTEEVKDFWFGISVASVSAGCLFVWTVGGRLSVAVCYNEVWFGKGVIKGYLKDLVGGLKEGLGI
ncbi:hypothetical protein TWF481_001326 [Arthrobotrys musiformis]|uniref:Uncharacterized protein n=1 Tax=Arthrobotrys musiformis TaxID=47236 RepID=A0AAV9WRN6_9PEZI